MNGNCESCQDHDDSDYKALKQWSLHSTLSGTLKSITTPSRVKESDSPVVHDECKTDSILEEQVCYEGKKSFVAIHCDQIPGYGDPPCIWEVGDDGAPSARCNVDPSKALISLDAGLYHTCALKLDGEVWCWGDNNFGQLGDQTTDQHLAPVKVKGIDDAVAVGAGLNFSCALLTDRTIKCWGANEFGQFGGTFGDKIMIPFKIPDSNGAVSLKVGLNSVISIMKDGEVIRLAPAALKGVVDGIQNPVNVDTSGVGVSCALKTDGTVWCWGKEYLEYDDPNNYEAFFESDEPVEIEGWDGFVEQISVGNFAQCGLVKGGKIKCWGIAPHGELGNGSFEPSLEPVEVQGLVGATHVDTNWQHTCAVLSDGEIWCWGSNSFTELGSGVGPHSALPKKVANIEDAMFVGVGGNHVCALSQDSKIRCWGDNMKGQVGWGQWLPVVEYPVEVAFPEE